MDSNPIHHPSAPKKMKWSFWIMFNFWWSARLLYGLKPIFHLSPAKKWNGYFWITFNFWWLAGLVDGLEPHPPPLSTQKKWNAHFWIMFNFWWLAGLVNGLKLPLLPLSSQKHELLLFGLHSTSDDRLGWSMDSNPIHHPSPAKTVKCSFLYYIQHVMLARMVNGLEPHPPPLCTQKNEMVILDYVQLLMIGRAGQWTETPSATPLQPKTWNATFWITFNFWWLAGLVNGLKPHPPPLSSQNSEMLIFVLHSTSDVGQTGQWTWTSSTTPLQPKNEMLIFGLHSTFDDWPGWSMDSNPIHHPFPAKKMKSSFLYYVEVLVISRAGWWTRTPSATPLQPKKWNAHFWILFKFWWLAGLVDGLEPHPPPLCTQKKWNAHFCITFNFWCWPDWSMDLNLIHHPSAPKKMKWSFWIMFNFWWLAGLVNGLKLPLPPLSSQKHEMLLFGLRSTSDDRLGWSMDSNPILHPSPPKTVKCSFLYYIQHLMLARLVNGLEPHPPPLCTQKNEMLILDYVQLLMISQAALWTQTHLPPLSCQKMKCLFLDYVQLLMISWAARWTWTRSIPHLQPENWNAHILIMFNFWW